MNPSKRILTPFIMSTLLVCALDMPMERAHAAATPPARINYQGVLRNAAGDPLNGAYEMTFRFYSLDTAGVEILTETRAFMTPAGPVVVTNGLFNAILGDGVVADGSGPGTYTNLAQVFRDYGVVWLEIQIGAEVLSPRVLVTASAYALNASNLEGKPAASFLDTSASDQVKTGTITVYGNQLGFGVTAASRGGGVRAYDSLGGAGLAEVGTGDYGLRVYGRGGAGTGMPGWFKDTQGSGEAWIAPGNSGLFAFGSASGGVFRRGTPSTFTDQVILANAGLGVDAFGSFTGGYFHNGASSALLATSSYGVSAEGPSGAWFIADSGYGVVGIGYPAGGTFTGDATGVQGTAWGVAGDFRTREPSLAFALVADSWNGLGVGVRAEGKGAGAYFKNMDNYDNQVYLATDYQGVWATGSLYGGYFGKTGALTSYTYLADNWGINSTGTYLSGAGGGQFRDHYYTGQAQLARGDVGVVAYGTVAAGVFRHGGETGWDNWANLADGSSSITGVGAKNFVQNHLYDPSAEIVYSSLEGDEVGTYTRGSAVLENGVARVPLSPSFAWVTNPDIGLTATVTPRGIPVPVAVESVSTTELVVRADAGAHDVAFDYLVQGLRAGFENATVVRPRRTDAPIPPMTEHADVYAARPELRQYNAMERFAAMPDKARGGKPVDPSRSEALIAAIGTGAINQPPARRRSLLTPEHAAQWALDHPGRSLAEMEALAPAPGGPDLSVPPDRPIEVPLAPAPPGPISAPRDGSGRPGIGPPAAQPSTASGANRLPVAEAVEPGDVLVNDSVRPGSFVRARQAGDRGVIGIVTGEPGARFLVEAQVALAGMVVFCKVDATELPIGTNDLLMASSLAGHAMRAGENPKQGTVIGKALEPLDSGTGVIRVLVMSR